MRSCDKCQWRLIDYKGSQEKGKQMASNYPEGSMRGSGIYAQEIELDKYCDTCEQEVSLVFITDDWGVNATAQCECGAEFEHEFSNERDDDADYDDWRQGQDENW
jgi:hypothetical protein